MARVCLYTPLVRLVREFTQGGDDLNFFCCCIALSHYDDPHCLFNVCVWDGNL